MHEKLSIKGMRWTVEMILDLLGSGMSTQEIMEDHSEFEREDILACLHFAKIQLPVRYMENVARLNFYATCQFRSNYRNSLRKRVLSAFI